MVGNIDHVTLLADIRHEAQDLQAAINNLMLRLDQLAVALDVADLRVQLQSWPPPSLRGQRRPGRVSKLDLDAELRAFFLARVHVMSFVAIAEAIKEHFPPDRRLAKSALARWWDTNGRSPLHHPR